jgi:hypothetical protein
MAYVYIMECVLGPLKTVDKFFVLLIPLNACRKFIGLWNSQMEAVRYSRAMQI